MKISISAGDTRLERESPTPRSWSWSRRSMTPFALRRRLMLERVALVRRGRLRVIDGGKA